MKRGGYGVRRQAGEMNKLEAQYALRLEAQRAAGEILWWRFEGAKLRLVDRDKLTTFTPDFLVQMPSLEVQLHEVKGGLFPEHNRLKLKLVADQYPFRVILAQFKNKATGWKIGEF